MRVRTPVSSVHPRLAHTCVTRTSCARVRAHSKHHVGRSHTSPHHAMPTRARPPRVRALTGTFDPPCARARLAHSHAMRPPETCARHALVTHSLTSPHLAMRMLVHMPRARSCAHHVVRACPPCARAHPAHVLRASCTSCALPRPSRAHSLPVRMPASCACSRRARVSHHAHAHAVRAPAPRCTRP